MNLITIDTRETELIKLLPSARIVQLPLGDAIVGPEEDPKVIIERKTTLDFAASIKDGRYKEQKIRLIENYVKKNVPVLYIIEGKCATNVNGISKLILNSAMVSMTFRDNIKVLRTDSVSDTAEVIERIATRWEEFNGNNGKIDYESIIKIEKRENVTPENILIFQLSQIPGVSPQIGKAIADKYKNMVSLCAALTDSKTLLGLKINDSRKIGSKVANNIYEYLCGLKIDSHVD